jgi:hypothetical protein
MSTIVSSDEQLRRALQWISEQRRSQPERSSLSVIEEAAMRFDLGPNQEQWLIHMLSEKKQSQTPES